MTATPTPSPLLEEDLPTIAYIVCGGRLYKDQPVSSLLVAEDRVATRKDGSRVEALVSKSAHDERIARLLAHIAEIDAKAKRYDWLRRQPNDTSTPRIDVVHWQAMDEAANSGEGLRLEELDNAIDAAIASEAKG